MVDVLRLHLIVQEEHANILIATISQCASGCRSFEVKLPPINRKQACLLDMQLKKLASEPGCQKPDSHISRSSRLSAVAALNREGAYRSSHGQEKVMF